MKILIMNISRVTKIGQKFSQAEKWAQSDSSFRMCAGRDPNRKYGQIVNDATEIELILRLYDFPVYEFVSSFLVSCDIDISNKVVLDFLGTEVSSSPLHFTTNSNR